VVPQAVRYVDDVNDNVNSKVNKTAVRAGTITALAALTTLVSSPAFAVTPDDGDDPGPGLSVAETLGLYVAIPLGIFLVISVLVMLGSRSGSGKQQR
jgi:hypothetical protein